MSLNSIGMGCTGSSKRGPLTGSKKDNCGYHYAPEVHINSLYHTQNDILGRLEGLHEILGIRIIWNGGEHQKV